MTPQALNPVIQLTKQQIYETLCHGYWCLFWADKLICPVRQKPIPLHRYLTIPIKSKVILFPIVSETPDNPKENRYKKHIGQSHKVSGLIYFKKSEWPEGTFDIPTSVCDLNNTPIEKTFEEVVSYQPVCIEDKFKREEKEKMLNYLLERDDLPGNIKTDLTEIYCSLPDSYNDIEQTI